MTAEELGNILRNFLEAVEAAAFVAKKQIAGIEHSEASGKPLQAKTLIQALDQLPWKTFHTKESAKPEEAAWIFSTVSHDLATELKAKGKVQDAKFEYGFSGKDDVFINRKPLKEPTK